MTSPDNRPRFLNLFKIYMPVTAVVSIIHRLTGVILFLFIPLTVYLFGLSLQGEAQFSRVAGYFSSLCFKLFVGIALLSLFYHLFAGIRFLLMDFDFGHSLKVARASAWLVLLVSLIVAVIIVGGML